MNETISRRFQPQASSKSNKKKKNVGVIPASRRRITLQSQIQIQDSQRIQPKILNINKNSPGIGILSSPFPRLTFPPLAHRKEYCPAGFIQCFRHRRVPHFRTKPFVVAIIVLQIIDCPIGEGLCVSLFMVQ